LSLPSVSIERTLAQFLALVQIDSPSYLEQGIAAALERELTLLGFAVENDRSGPNGIGNVVGRLAGAAGQPIALIAHTDTVEPGRGIRPRVVDGVVQSDGTTILGADNKQAIAAILEAVRAVRESGRPHPPIEVVFTWGEEKGHQGAKALDLGRLASRLGFVFDVGGPVGDVVTETPTHVGIRAIFRGRAAHAGIEPEAGISAIAAAAMAIARMRLGRLDAETTANVGTITGGTVRNAVPEVCAFEAEARSLDEGSLARQVEAMRTACEDGASTVGARVELEIVRSYDGFHLDPVSPVVCRAVEAISAVGLVPRLTRTGGGSDANSLNARGLPTVNLGTGMRDLHSTRESVDVDDIERLARVIVALIVRPP
jgi:tripeptide aminopeptidase